LSEYEKQISNLKENLDKAKNLRIRAEARLEQLNKQKEEILREIETLGVKPEELDSQILKLKQEMEDLIQKANAMLPQGL
jgi:chromosome segregation ATPase